jgi:hypothetical protein
MEAERCEVQQTNGNEGKNSLVPSWVSNDEDDNFNAHIENNAPFGSSRPSPSCSLSPSAPVVQRKRVGNAGEDAACAKRQHLNIPDGKSRPPLYPWPNCLGLTSMAPSGCDRVATPQVIEATYHRWHQRFILVDGQPISVPEEHDGKGLLDEEEDNFLDGGRSEFVQGNSGH